MTTNGKTAESHHDAHELIERAKKFSVKVPLVGTVRVPPPDQLAFYGVLGVLAAVSVIDWPVALAVGAGQAILSRHMSEQKGGASSAAETPAKAPAEAKPHTASKQARSANSARS